MVHDPGHRTARSGPPVAGCLAGLLVIWMLTATAFAADPPRSFSAVMVDATGVKTDVTDVVFYWEEKLNETQMALHELTHVPAKRGAVPIHIEFGRIKQIEFTPGSDHGQPQLTITLKNGKTGTFTLEIAGSFKGQTDFGEMIASPAQLTRITFK